MCLHLPLSRSQSEIVSKFSHSLIEKPKLPNLTLPGSLFNYTLLSLIYLSCMPSFKIIGILIMTKKFLKLFTIYGRGCDLGHLYKLSFPIPEKTPEIWL